MARKQNDEIPDITDLTYRVKWSYVDQFHIDRRGQSDPMDTVAEAQSYASVKFEVDKPDAWWIESATTVEYHMKDVPF